MGNGRKRHTTFLLSRNKRILRKVNPSTPRPKGRGLLRVDPEPRSFTPSSKTGLGAAERVNVDERGKAPQSASSY